MTWRDNIGKTHLRMLHPAQVLAFDAFERAPIKPDKIVALGPEACRTLGHPLNWMVTTVRLNESLTDYLKRRTQDLCIPRKEYE